MKQRVIKHAHIFMLVATVLITAGCETLDQGQCVTADWRDMGYQDGSAGKPKSSVSSYASDCSQYGVKVDAGAYRDGWNRGIPQYCTANNGYRVGSSGGYYADSCTGNLKDAFYSAYLLGDAVYEAQSRVNRLQAEVDKLGDKASENGLTDERRTQLRKDRKNRKRDLKGARFDLFSANLRADKNGF